MNTEPGREVTGVDSSIGIDSSIGMDQLFLLHSF